ncbi:hypothetical protein Efla_002093 [Eimeria flavescens]
MPVTAAAHALRAVVSSGSLCPSRTLSLLLGLYEDFLWAPNDLLPLIRLFSSSKIREVIGFTLHLYADAHRHNKQQQQQQQQEWGSSSNSSNGSSSGSSSRKLDSALSRTAESEMGALRGALLTSTAQGPSKEFYDLLAVLLMRGILSLDELYPFLQPADASLLLLFDRLACRYQEALSHALAGSPQPPPKQPAAGAAAAGGAAAMAAAAGAAGTTAAGDASSPQQQQSRASGSQFGASYGASPSAWGGSLSRGLRDEWRQQQQQQRDSPASATPSAAAAAAAAASAEAAAAAELPQGVELLLSSSDRTYRAARDSVFLMSIPKFELLASLLDFNCFEAAQRLLLHFTGKLKVLPSANGRVHQSLVNYISWLIAPILRGPEASLRELLAAHAKAVGSSPSASGQRGFKGGAGGDEWEERIPPTGERLAALRRAAAHEGSLDLSTLPRIWLGLLLPSLSSSPPPAATAAAAAEPGATAAEPAAAAAGDGFRCQGMSQCHSFSDFFSKAVPLLRLLHASLAFAPRLLVGVLGICKEYAAAVKAGREPRDANFENLADFVAETLFPAVSQVLHGAPSTNAFLWSFLRELPPHRRYSIYDRVMRMWKQRHCPLALNYELSRIKLRKLLKRLTSSIFSRKARNSDRWILAEIASLSLTAPLPLAEAVITQGDLFDGNMVQTLTEATRRISSVAADVFASRFVQRQLLRKDSGGERDGVTLSKKLQNRAAMAGRFFRIHKETDLRPLLVSTLTRMWCELHVTDVQRFRRRREGGPEEDTACSPATAAVESMAVDGETEEETQEKTRGHFVTIAGKNADYPCQLVGFFRDKEYVECLLELVGGCLKLPEAGALTADQIYAQAGGPLLKCEVMLVGSEDESAAADSRAQRALTEALRDRRLVLPLLLIPAKIRAELLYDAEYRQPMRVFAACIDDLHRYHLQLLEYLTRSFARPAYEALIPDKETLFLFLPPAMAWAFLRPALPDFVKTTRSTTSSSSSSRKQQGEGSGPSGAASPVCTPQAKQAAALEAATPAGPSAAEEETASSTDSQVSPVSAAEASFVEGWHEGLQPLLKLTGIEGQQLHGLSPSFLLLFWRLSLQDVIVPSQQYEACLVKLQTAVNETQRAIEDIERYRRNNTSSSSSSSSSSSQPTAAMQAVGVCDFSKKEEEALRKRRLKLKQHRRALELEWEQQKERQAAVCVALREESRSWLLLQQTTSKQQQQQQQQTLLHADSCDSDGASSILSLSRRSSAAEDALLQQETPRARKQPATAAASAADATSAAAAASSAAAAAAGGGESKAGSSKRGPFALRAIIKFMLAPRIVNSEADALFCAQFVWLLVSLRLPLFNFLDFMNIWTRMLVPLIRSSTEREAQMLGLFVSEILGPVRRWLHDKQAFEEETAGNCCFGLTYRFAGNNAQHAHIAKGARKWEARIFEGLVQSLPQASAAGEAANPSAWLETKAAVVFLSRCHDSFPLTCRRGAELIKRLEDTLVAAQAWNWKDVSLSASSIVKVLTKHQRDGRWLDPAPAAAAATAAATTAAAATATTAAASAAADDKHKTAPAPQATLTAHKETPTLSHQQPSSSSSSSKTGGETPKLQQTAASAPSPFGALASRAKNALTGVAGDAGPQVKRAKTDTAADAARTAAPTAAAAAAPQAAAIPTAPAAAASGTAAPAVPAAAAEAPSSSSGGKPSARSAAAAAAAAAPPAAAAPAAAAPAVSSSATPVRRSPLGPEAVSLMKARMAGIAGAAAQGGGQPEAARQSSSSSSSSNSNKSSSSSSSSAAKEHHKGSSSASAASNKALPSSAAVSSSSSSSSSNPDSSSSSSSRPGSGSGKTSSSGLLSPKQVRSAEDHLAAGQVNTAPSSSSSSSSTKNSSSSSKTDQASSRGRRESSATAAANNEGGRRTDGGSSRHAGSHKSDAGSSRGAAASGGSGPPGLTSSSSSGSSSGSSGSSSGRGDTADAAQSSRSRTGASSGSSGSSNSSSSSNREASKSSRQHLHSSGKGPGDSHSSSSSSSGSRSSSSSSSARGSHQGTGGSRSGGSSSSSSSSKPASSNGAPTTGRPSSGGGSGSSSSSSSSSGSGGTSGSSSRDSNRHRGHGGSSSRGSSGLLGSRVAPKAPPPIVGGRAPGSSKTAAAPAAAAAATATPQHAAAPPPSSSSNPPSSVAGSSGAGGVAASRTQGGADGTAAAGNSSSSNNNSSSSSKREADSRGDEARKCQRVGEAEGHGGARAAAARGPSKLAAASSVSAAAAAADSSHPQPRNALFAQQGDQRSSRN